MSAAYGHIPRTANRVRWDDIGYQFPPAAGRARGETLVTSSLIGRR